MITRKQVIEAYELALDLGVRRMLIERDRGEETPEEADERLDAVTHHFTLELQYLAQHT